jgi:3-hydroxyisobutyrate dehydrogenase-like beta-hydroxyacid dehydrogenase
MSDISTLGLGLMGSAVARSFIHAGHRLTVWNRSGAKTQSLVQLGASAAGSVPAALAASPVVLICIDGYRTTQALFDEPEAVNLLPGRVIVQLTTGSPSEARRADAWFSARGAQYLDGAILGGPATMGTPKGTVLYSGRREIFDRCTALLGALGGGTRFIGEKIGAAAAIDMAYLARQYGMYAGIAHGVLICEAEGADLEAYASVFAENDTGRWMIDVIRKDAFSNPPATLSVWSAALHRLQEQAREAGINSAVPDLVSGILDRAEAAGFGAEHIAAMVKVLRKEGHAVAEAQLIGAAEKSR